MASSPAVRETFTADACTMRRAKASAALVALLAMGVALAVEPRMATILPACPVREYLGVLCPGCGGTHAMLALLHGHVAEAWQSNALYVALLPLAVWFLGESYRRAMLAREFRWPKIPAGVMYAIAAAAFLFTVGRNWI